MEKKLKNTDFLINDRNLLILEFLSMKGRFNMEKYFLLSVVIPTKNREKYAVETIKQIMSMNDERIQVVIQDNSDTDLLAELLSEYKSDKRLKYNYTAGIISFIDNFDLAVNQADGEYICTIGDDDGLVPQIIDVVLWAKDNKVDAIKPELNAVYFWPKSAALKKNVDNGYMNISKITTNAKLCNPIGEVGKLLRQGGQNYLSLDMVKLYHGIVRSDCLEKVKKITGKYFGGLSPDIYMSVALSLTVDRMVKIDMPLTISGICNKSGSSDSATGKHTGKLEDAPHFRGHLNYEWSEFVPRFYSVDTIWADSALAAMKDLNRLELVKNFNVEYLYINCLIKYPQFKDIIIADYKKLMKKTSISTITNASTYFIYNINNILKRVLRKIIRRKDDHFQVNGISDIFRANIILQNRLEEIGVDTVKIVKSLDSILKR